MATPALAGMAHDVALPPRRYAMCPPHYFDVAYRINPWMNPGQPVDRRLAVEQWSELRHTLEGLGHHVDVIEPCPGLPDMVFAANGAVVLGGRAVAARMAVRERAGEEAPYRRWLASQGLDIRVARHPCEGQGDFVLVRGAFLAGTGFRTTVGAHREVAAAFGIPVVTLRLVDPRWYHLDMALFALDDETIAYYPGAFDIQSRSRLERRFPNALIATEADALAFGLNAVSDGHHVVVPQGAAHLVDALCQRGYAPVPVDVSQLHRAGGSVKCCVLELHASLTA